MIFINKVTQFIKGVLFHPGFYRFKATTIINTGITDDLLVMCSFQHAEKEALVKACQTGSRQHKGVYAVWYKFTPHSYIEVYNLVVLTVRVS